MATFFITPTGLDEYDRLVRDPVTQLWILPTMKFNTRLYNPYLGEVDLINENYQYQNSVIDHFYIALTEKWLFKKIMFRKLLKYFKVDKKGDEGKISLITDIDKIKDPEFDEVTSKYIFKYIEKYFISRKFVEKVLREYVNTTHIKWYDLFNNTDTLKELFAHKLKKKIINTIYEAKQK